MRISDWSSDVCSSDLSFTNGRIRRWKQDAPISAALGLSPSSYFKRAKGKRFLKDETCPHVFRLPSGSEPPCLLCPTPSRRWCDPMASLPWPWLHSAAPARRQIGRGAWRERGGQ